MITRLNLLLGVARGILPRLNLWLIIVLLANVVLWAVIIKLMERL